MRIITLLCLSLLSIHVAQATHLLGGYIQAKPAPNSALTYDVTVTLYLDGANGAAASSAMSSLTLCFGDGTTAEAQRLSNQPLPTDRTVSQSTYRVSHAYAGPGVFTIAVVISNRSAVQNIRGAADQFFALSTTFTVGAITPNGTPTLFIPETGFQIAANQRVVFPLRSTDSEGDSLSYGLKTPLGGTGPCAARTVAAYQFPNDLTRQGTFKLNHRTGDLTWDAPTQLGRYSVAVTVSEYRNGGLISQTVQEISLLVVDRSGTPGIIPAYEPAVEGDVSIIPGVVTAVPDSPADKAMLTVFPNPVDDRLQVLVQTGNPATAAIRLVDATGRIRHELNFGRPARQHEQVISMDSLTPGVYFLRADVAGETFVRKVLKK